MPTGKDTIALQVYLPKAEVKRFKEKAKRESRTLSNWIYISMVRNLQLEAQNNQKIA